MSEIKKNPVGRPAVNATPLTVRVTPELLEAVDKLAAAINGTRPDALRYALRTYMESDGFLPHKPRIGQDLLLNFTRKDAEALKNAFGPDIAVQQEALEDLVRDWLVQRGYLKD